LLADATQVAGEPSLHVLAYNVKRVMQIVGIRPRMQAPVGGADHGAETVDRGRLPDSVMQKSTACPRTR